MDMKQKNRIIPVFFHMEHALTLQIILGHQMSAYRL